MSGPSKFMIKRARKSGKRYGVKPSDLLDLMQYESSFNPGAVSSAGAQGLTQFIPSTAQQYGVKYGTSKKAQKTQIRGAAKYLHDLGYGSGSDAEVRKALAGYYGASSPYADRLIAQHTYEKYDKKLKGGTASFGSSKGSETKTKTKSVQTAAAVSNAGARAQAALSFIQTENKDFTDYLAYSDTMKSLQDIPAQFKQVKTKVKGAKEPGQVQAQGVAGKGGGPQLKGSSKHEVVQVGKWAEKKFGLAVGENPAFGGVAPVHATNSYHYSGRAIDVSGSPDAMRKFAHAVAKKYGPHLAELFWQGKGGINYDNGQQVAQGYVSDHTDHVHVAF